MKIKLFIIALIFFAASLLFTDNSYSQLFDKEGLSTSYAASTWRTETKTSSYLQSQTEMLSLYFNTYKNKIGFKIYNTENFDRLEYVVSYSHTTEFGFIDEMITGIFDNSSHMNEITEEWIILGTCSSGGTCVYHHGIQNINLQIVLISSGTIQKTMSDSI